MIEPHDAFRPSHFEDLIEQSSDLIQCVDKNGRFLYVNQSWSNALGYSKKEAQTLHLEDIFHPDSVSHWKSIFKRVLAGLSVGEIEATFLTKSGETLDVQGHIDSKWDYNGNPSYTRATFRDITDKKRLERQNEMIRLQLVESNELHQLLSTVMTNTVDPDNGNFDERITDALKAFGKFVSVDRAYIFHYDFENNLTSNTHEWCEEDIDPQIDELQNIPLEDIRDWVNSHREGREVMINNIFLLPENDRVRQILEPQGIKSILTVPMMRKNDCFGFVGFESVSHYHPFTEMEKRILFQLSHFLLNVFERKRISDDLSSSNRQLQTIMDTQSELVCKFDRDFNLSFSNRAFEQTLKPKSAEADASHLSTYMNNESFRVLKEHINGLMKSGTPKALRITANGYENDLVIEWNVYVTRYQNGSVSEFISVGYDVTEKEKLEEQLLFMAYHDQLTGLLNRCGFERGFHNVYGKGACHLIMLDIDDFNMINTIYGSATGDATLIETGRILGLLANSTDLVSRIASDEFMMCIHSDELWQEQLFLNRLNELVKQSFEEGRIPQRLHVSIGYTLFDPTAQSFEKAYQEAALALKSAKEASGTAIHAYMNWMYMDLARINDIQKGLRSGLKENEFWMEYQKKINISSRSVTGLEALARWNSKTLGHVTPSEFIPVFSKSEAIDHFSEWVIKRVFQDLPMLKAKYGSDIKLSINLSPRVLLKKDFSSWLNDMREKHKIDKQTIILEITEDVFLEDLNLVNDLLKTIRRNGFLISLDDFGSGFASLSYLQNMLIDEVKIDKSITRQVVSDDKHLVLIRAIINIAVAFKISAVIEGIESDSQLELLKPLGDFDVQGYLLHRPERL